MLWSILSREVEIALSILNDALLTAYTLDKKIEEQLSRIVSELRELHKMIIEKEAETWSDSILEYKRTRSI